MRRVSAKVKGQDGGETSHDEAELEVAEQKTLSFSLGVTRMDRIKNEVIRGTTQTGRLGEKAREERLRRNTHTKKSINFFFTLIFPLKLLNRDLRHRHGKQTNRMSSHRQWRRGIDTGYLGGRRATVGPICRCIATFLHLCFGSSACDRERFDSHHSVVFGHRIAEVKALLWSLTGVLRRGNPGIRPIRENRPVRCHLLKPATREHK